MLARLFVFIGGLIVLALTAALVVPYFIDWTSYRADFEREASAILGRKVTVEGEARARLLPFPSVTFSDVAVGGGPDGGAALTMETFSMDAELAPFLSGEFLIFDMRMVRPRGTIDVADDGTVDWAVRPSSPIDASHISIEKLTVTEGQVEVRHAASGRTHKLSEINTEISARALTGPWRVTGSMRLDGIVTAVSASTGTVDDTGAMRLRIRAEPAIYPASVEADGNIRFDNNAAAYSGQFKLSPKPPAATAQAKASERENDPGFRLNGRFSLDHTKLSVDEFQFETGPLDNPYTADGTGLLEFGKEPRFALTASGAQVRFDEAVGAAEETNGLTFTQRLEALEATLATLPKPNIPGTIEVDLPAIVVGDTTIREVRFSAEPVPTGWSVKSLSATLPGRTTLEADGELATYDKLGFKGSLLVAIGQPSGFAAWVSKDVDDAIRRLPAAGFQAKVDLTRDRQVFDNLELALGSATFRGKAESIGPADARPATVLKLTGGALDVDGLAAFASLFVSDEGDNRFADRDFDLEVKAGPLDAAGLTAETVDAALRLRSGTLDIDRLSIGGLAGASVSAAGKIRNISDNPIGNIDASIVSVDLAPLIAAASKRFPNSVLVRGLDQRVAAYPGLLTDARIDVIATVAASGATTQMALNAQGKAGGTALSMSLSANGDRAAPDQADVSLTVNGRNDDATALLALYGLPVLPLGLAGPAETELSLKGTLAGGLATALRLTGSDLTTLFSGTTSMDGPEMSAKGVFSVDAADIEPWLITVGGALPGMGAGTPVQLDANLDYANGLLMLSDISGTVNEGAVAGDLNVELREGKPHLIGQLALDTLDLEPLAAVVLGAASLEGSEKAWSSVPFQPRSASPFDADLDLTAATIAAGPALTAYDTTLTLKLDGEGIRISDVSGKLFGGDATGRFELKNTDGTALASGQVKVAGADISSVLGDTGLSGSADFSTALSASGKTVGGLVAALSGSGTTALKSLTVGGVNPDAFSQFIAKANEIGRDIDAAKTAAFAPQVAAEGSFSAAPAEAAFTVAGGILRAPPLTLDNPAATIEADVQADLNKSEVTATGEVAYRPGDEALVGSSPVMRFSLAGPLGATVRTFDSELLAQFLTQRALEIEQARVEAMQDALLEKQRLRREVRYYASLQDDRNRAAELLRRQQEEERLKAEEKLRAEAAEREAKARAEAEAAEEAKRQLEQEAENAKRQADEAKRKADEAIRKAEAARAAAEAAAPPTESERTGDIQREPLPAPRPDPLKQAEPPGIEPDSVDGFLKMLQGTN